MGLNHSKLQNFYELVEHFDTAMMTTITPQGMLISRPMASQLDILDDSDVWFVTAIDSEKVHDLEIDPRVNISYFKGGDRAWVSLAGRAWLDTDKERIAKLWKEDWRIWFPNGPDDSKLALVHVEALHVTFWQPEGGRIATLFSAAKAYVSGETPHMNPPEDIDLNSYISG